MSLARTGAVSREEIYMKAYVITTGVVFALLTVAHLLRIIAEWPQLAKDPFFLLITIVAGGLCVWALWLLRLSKRPNAG